MSRYTGPKNRLARREGADLGLKTVGSHAHAQLLRRLNVPPGQHGSKRKRKTSEYAMQLREKQKARRTYGLSERQFRRYFEMAKKWRGNTGDMLLQFLERRLDNTLYRLSFAPTRAAARQLVSHRHVVVDGKRVGIPSYSVHADQVITLSSKALEIPAIRRLLDEKTVVLPEWLDRKAGAGKVLRLPERADVKEDISEQVVIEFYSR